MDQIRLWNCHQVLGLLETHFVPFPLLKEYPRKKETWKISWKHPDFELEYPKKSPANQADPVNQKDCPGSPERIPLNERFEGEEGEIE